MAGNVWRQLKFWVLRRRIEAELQEEMETHRSLREEALRRLDDPAPHSSSRKALGNVVLAREDARGVWIAPAIEIFLLDLRHGARALRRRPTIAAAILLTIAVGTAALTTAAAVAHTVLVKATPYTNADRIVQLRQLRDGRGRSEVASVDIDAVRASGALERVSFAWIRSVSLTGDGLPENARAVFTDADLFPLLGTTPLLGRWPTTGDMTNVAPPVVISHALWRRRYQLQPQAVGSTVEINGTRHVIVAVMPESFKFPAPYYVWGDLWLFRPADHPSLAEPARPILLAFGLLKPQQTRQMAQAQLVSASKGLEDVYPATHKGVTFQVTEWAESLKRNSRPTLLLLLAAAAMVFVIVCINVVNLLLCRGLDRATEIQTRASLGAGAGRLTLQLMTETMLMFVLGGGVGIVLAAWTARVVATMAPFDIPRMNETTLGWPVAAAGFVLALVAGLIVGWLPARGTVQAAGHGPITTRSATPHRQGRRVQRGLITLEIGLAMVLGCGAVSIAIHAADQAAIDVGFDTTHLVQGRLAVPTDRYPDDASQARVIADVLARLRAHPSIAAASMVDLPPGVAGGPQPSVALDGDVIPARVQDLRSAAIRVVSDGYFETLGLQATTGHTSTAAPTAPEAVVNLAFVRAYLAGREPIGARVRVSLDGLAGLDRDLRTIVGVVPDLPEDVLYKPAPPTVYVPVGQAPASRMAIIARGRVSSDLGLTLREILAAAMPNTAINGLVMPLGDLMSSEFARTRASLRLVGALAIVALVLAVIGVYGVIAHGVQHRTREIGIRLALGVSPGAIRHMVLREGAWLLIAGLVVGGATAVWFSPAMKALVVGADHLPVGTALAVTGAALLVAVLAGCDIPARRASRVDPTTALR